MPSPIRFASSVCSLDFYQQVACETGSFFTPLEETTTPAGPRTCELTDFGAVAAYRKH